MMTNHAYIPFASGRDATIADMLIEAERRFEKPLNYDCRTITLPNYTLLDRAEIRRVNIVIQSGPDDRLTFPAMEESATWIWDGSRVMTSKVLPPTGLVARTAARTVGQ